jgi:uncharacterized phage protein (TIGR02218 family)
MKTVSTALNAHMQGNPTTLAIIAKIKRVDGTILGFTGHDQDITYTDGDGDNVTYLHSTGLTASAVASKSDLSVDNLESTGFLESESLTESDIRAGLYDYSTIEIRVLNWADLTMGDMMLRSGTIGPLEMTNGQFKAEVRGLTHMLSTILGSLYGPICRAQFGSGLNGIDLLSQWLCKVDVTAYQQTGSVNTSADAVTIVPETGLLMIGSATPTVAAPADWFNDGILVFTSGTLSGRGASIKTWDGTTLKLFLPISAAAGPVHGDTFTIEPGCNHTKFDCANKFNNIVNIRAEIYIPGMDVLVYSPDSL